jgi:hypothetical protein
MFRGRLIELLHAALRHCVQVVDSRTSLLWRLEKSGGFTNHRMKRIHSEWAAMVDRLDLRAHKLAIDIFQVIHAPWRNHSGCGGQLMRPDMMAQICFLALCSRSVG